MSELNPETTEARTETVRGLEPILQQLWEKARRVSALLVRMRDENIALRTRVRELEDSGRSVYTEREKLIVRLAQEESQGRGAVEEVAALRQKVRQLEESETNARRQLDEVTVQGEAARRELTRLQSNGTGPFSREEKEELRTRVQELIHKITTRL